jgi:hypothetical protein
VPVCRFADLPPLDRRHDRDQSTSKSYAFGRIRINIDVDDARSAGAGQRSPSVANRRRGHQLLRPRHRVAPSLPNAGRPSSPASCWLLSWLCPGLSWVILPAVKPEVGGAG